MENKNIWKYIAAAFSLLVAIIFFQRNKVKSLLSDLSLSNTREADATLKEKLVNNETRIQEEAAFRAILKKAYEDRIGKTLSVEETEEFFKKRGF